MKKCCLTLLFILFTPVLCYGQHKEELIDAVKRYNSVLIKVYETTDLNLLNQVATVNQLSRVYPVVQALVNQNSIMIAQQKYFQVKDLKIKGTKAEVVTEELWFYWWQSKQDGRITKTPQEAFYKIKYYLIKEKNVWKVDKLEEIK